MTNETDSVRIDKWLWAARFFKTRQLAAAAVKGGRVSLNGDRPKPAKAVQVGDELVITREALRYHVTVLKTGDRRVSAPLAQQMYEESAESIAAREERTAQIKAARIGMVRSEGRPTKRERRDLDRFRRR